MFIRGKFVASDDEIKVALVSFNYGGFISDLTLNDFRDWCYINFVQMHSELDVYTAVFQCMKSNYI